MNSTIPALSATNLHKSYPSKAGDGKVLRILEDVDLTIESASVIAIVGSSGSGKSTLLHILGGLDKPDTGDVFWNNQLISSMPDEKIADERNKHVGFVFQFHHLLPEFSAVENVMMPALIGGQKQSEATQRAMYLLDRFGIADRAHHRPSQLSGGEQQRVSLARAMMNKPSLILADEPTGNLDETNTESVLSELFSLRDTDQISIVLVTHEKEIAARCDKVYEMRHGSLDVLNDR
jgi:lipoprotein-releasing system ATP-binding protein